MNSKKSRFTRKPSLRNSPQEVEEANLNVNLKNPQRMLSPNPGKRNIFEDTTAEPKIIDHKSYLNRVLCTSRGFTVYLNKTGDNRNITPMSERYIPQMSRRAQRKALSPAPVAHRPRLPTIPKKLKADIIQKMRVIDSQRNASNPVTSNTLFQSKCQSLTPKLVPSRVKRTRKFQLANFSRYFSPLFL